MIFGLDIGGSKIEIAVFNDDLQPVDRWRVATPKKSYSHFVEALASLVHEADQKFEQAPVVGIGMPGLVDQEGRSLSVNIPAANGQNVAKYLSKKIDRPVVSENDCRCFALSEAVGGAGDDYSTVYGAIIGTGAAGGFTINGELLPSRQGIAGEYGHQQLCAKLKQKYLLPLKRCGCGLPSCYEGYISGPGLVFLGRHFGCFRETAQDIVAAWQEGDEAAKVTMNCYIDLLGALFSTLVMAYDPEAIVVGGGMSLSPGLLEALPKSVENYLFAHFSSPPILRAKFGDSSGARGAAILARRAINA